MNKKVLYLTNIEVPYRNKFFNELSKKCDLTVLYERNKSKNRDAKWASSEGASYNKKCYNGLEIGNENAISLKFLLEVLKGYDVVIVGCYNSIIQMFAILLMRVFRVRYFVNIDGEQFLNKKGLKTVLKKFFLNGAEKILAAGEKTADNLKKDMPSAVVIPYYFSSLLEEEIKHNSVNMENKERNDTVLVIGQYFDYKGMDIAVQAAKMDTSIRYKFVGMGNRTELFCDEQEVRSLNNVEIIPFLNKHELEIEYKNCMMLVLPSRQECWGLVINEAASYGMPIVSTLGSGAAVEFLEGSEYECFLANADDSVSLYEKIKLLKNYANKNKYVQYLIDKSEQYSVQKNVEIHMETIGH